MSDTDKNSSSIREEYHTRTNELKLMHLNRIIAHIAFICPTKRIAVNPFLSKLYRLFTPFAFVMYTFIITTQSLGVYHYWGDLDITMEDLFLTLGFVMCYWEGAYMNFKSRQIWRIFDKLDSTALPIVSNPILREKHEIIIKEVTSRCKALSWFVFISVNLGTLMWAIFPLVNLLIHSMSEDGIAKKDENKPWPYLMYIIWVPYDTSVMPMYAVTYAIQVLVYFTAALYNTSSNILFLTLVLHATAKFKIVEHSLLFMEELMYKTNSNQMMGNVKESLSLSLTTYKKKPFKNGSKDTELYLQARPTSKMFENSSLNIMNESVLLNVELNHNSSELEANLIECIKQHQDAITFARELNSIVSPWIAFALLIHQLLLVAEVFQLALTAGSSFAVLKHFMSIIGVLSQSLLLCWLGDRLIQQSVRVNSAAYVCSWYNQSTRFKRLLLMLIKHAQHPVKFSAGNFYDINIEKFEHILRRAYSYYTVLRNMKEV